VRETTLPLIIEIALGLVLGVFLLWAIPAIVVTVGVAIGSIFESIDDSLLPAPKREPTVWLICIGDLKLCPGDEIAEAKGLCCRDMVYNPAFADTVHQFDTYEEARVWAKEMVNVPLVETPTQSFVSEREDDRPKYWHGNLEVYEVTPTSAARWMEHRIADGKFDPVYLAEGEARLKVADEKRVAEEAAHIARMQERLAPGRDLKR